ncbi:MAG: 30S ribosomal protein S6 [Pseudomonadota bacterium]
MALYEHVFIARQDLSNAQAEGLMEHFGQVLSDNGGKVVDSEYWGLRTMAYKINKNRKGHYGFMKSDSPSAAVQEMERLMRIHDDIMRVMTVKVDAHEEGPSAVVLAKNSRDERRGGRDRDDRGPRRDRDDRPPRRDRDDRPPRREEA